MQAHKTDKPKSLIFTFLSLSSSFLFFLLVFIVSIYVVGNYRDFLDETLILILKISVALAIILFLIASASFISSFYMLITKRRFPFLISLLMSFVYIIVSIVSALVNTLIIVIS